MSWDSVEIGLQNEAAVTKLRAKALSFQADAVRGIGLDYSAIGNNIVSVVTNGTAVRLESVSPAP
ncbi:MAG: heavy metal-binding domain-containing protein [Anaerolineales bacterium]|jgi:uncharacterized protein YbjQ (UPF0145 family)